MSPDQDPRRERILAAAREVFAREGFRAAEVTTIARTAGVGKATIYRFFESKEQLLMVIVEENLNQVRDLALRHLLSEGQPLQRLENACRAVARFIGANQAFTRVLVQEAGEFAGEIQRRHLALLEQNMPVAEVFFGELRKDGYFVALSPRETMQMMMDLIFGSAYTWSLTGQGDLEQQAVSYMRVLVAGMREPLPSLER